MPYLLTLQSHPTVSPNLAITTCKSQARPNPPIHPHARHCYCCDQQKSPSPGSPHSNRQVSSSPAPNLPSQRCKQIRRGALNSKRAWVSPEGVRERKHENRHSSQHYLWPVTKHKANFSMRVGLPSSKGERSQNYSSDHRAGSSHPIQFRTQRSKQHPIRHRQNSPPQESSQAGRQHHPSHIRPQQPATRNSPPAMIPLRPRSPQIRIIDQTKKNPSMDSVHTTRKGRSSGKVIPPSGQGPQRGTKDILKVMRRSGEGEISGSTNMKRVSHHYPVNRMMTRQKENKDGYVGVRKGDLPQQVLRGQNRRSRQLRIEDVSERVIVEGDMEVIAIRQGSSNFAQFEEIGFSSQKTERITASNFPPSLYPHQLQEEGPSQQQQYGIISPNPHPHQQQSCSAVSPQLSPKKVSPLVQSSTEQRETEGVLKNQMEPRSNSPLSSVQKNILTSQGMQNQPQEIPSRKVEVKIRQNQSFQLKTVPLEKKQVDESFHRQEERGQTILLQSQQDQDENHLGSPPVLLASSQPLEFLKQDNSQLVIQQQRQHNVNTSYLQTESDLSSNQYHLQIERMTDGAMETRIDNKGCVRYLMSGSQVMERQEGIEVKQGNRRNSHQVGMTKILDNQMLKSKVIRQMVEQQSINNKQSKPIQLSNLFLPLVNQNNIKQQQQYQQQNKYRILPIIQQSSYKEISPILMKQQYNNYDIMGIIEGRKEQGKKQEKEGQILLDNKIVQYNDFNNISHHNHLIKSISNSSSQFSCGVLPLTTLQSKYLIPSSLLPSTPVSSHSHPSIQKESQGESLPTSSACEVASLRSCSKIIPSVQRMLIDEQGEGLKLQLMPNSLKENSLWMMSMGQLSMKQVDKQQVVKEEGGSGQVQGIQEEVGDEDILLYGAIAHPILSLPKNHFNSIQKQPSEHKIPTLPPRQHSIQQSQQKTNKKIETQFNQVYNLSPQHHSSPNQPPLLIDFNSQTDQLLPLHTPFHPLLSRQDESQYEEEGVVVLEQKQNTRIKPTPQRLSKHNCQPQMYVILQSQNTSCIYLSEQYSTPPNNHEKKREDHEIDNIQKEEQKVKEGDRQKSISQIEGQGQGKGQGKGQGQGQGQRQGQGYREGDILQDVVGEKDSSIEEPMSKKEEQQQDEELPFILKRVQYQTPFISIDLQNQPQPPTEIISAAIEFVTQHHPSLLKQLFNHTATKACLFLNQEWTLFASADSSPLSLPFLLSHNSSLHTPIQQLVSMLTGWPMRRIDHPRSSKLISALHTFLINKEKSSPQPLCLVREGSRLIEVERVRQFLGSKGTTTPILECGGGGQRLHLQGSEVSNFTLLYPLSNPTFIPLSLQPGQINTFQLQLGKGNLYITATYRLLLYWQAAHDNYHLVSQHKHLLQYTITSRARFLLIAEPLHKEQGQSVITIRIEGQEEFVGRVGGVEPGKRTKDETGYENSRNVYVPVVKEVVSENDI